MRFTTLYTSVFASLVLFLGGACSEDADEPVLCPDGTENCPCTNVGTCAIGLMCTADKCIVGTPPATGGASTGGASTGGAASGGAATGGESPTGGTSAGGAPTGGAAMGGAASGGEGSGGDGSGGDGSGGDGSGGDQGGGAFTLTSAELAEGEEFPDAYTCESGEFFSRPSPSFAWTGVPEGTMSFAMVMIDKTLVDDGEPNGYHSAFWNLDASETSLPIDLANNGPVAGSSDVINSGYLGPCPGGATPPPPHEYVFTLYALPEATMSLGTELDAAFIQTLEAAALAEASLMGISSITTGPAD